jgi:hypothetical protein
MSDKAVLDLLKKMDQKLDRLENRIDQLEKEKTQLALDGLSILGDSIDEKFNPHTEKGMKNLDKMNRVLKSLDTLTEQETIDSAMLLADNLKNFADLAMKTRQVEDVISILLDSYDDFFARAMDQGLDIEDFSANLKRFSFLMLDEQRTLKITKS